MCARELSSPIPASMPAPRRISWKPGGYSAKRWRATQSFSWLIASWPAFTIGFIFLAPITLLNGLLLPTPPFEPRCNCDRRPARLISRWLRTFTTDISIAMGPGGNWISPARGCRTKPLSSRLALTLPGGRVAGRRRHTNSNARLRWIRKTFIPWNRLPFSMRICGVFPIWLRLWIGPWQSIPRVSPPASSERMWSSNGGPNRSDYTTPFRKLSAGIRMKPAKLRTSGFSSRSANATRRRPLAPWLRWGLIAVGTNGSLFPAPGAKAR